MDPEEKLMLARIANSERSLNWYHAHREEISERRRNDRDRKMRQCLYQQAYYQKMKALKAKEVKKLKIQPETAQTQQANFEISFD